MQKGIRGTEAEGLLIVAAASACFSWLCLCVAHQLLCAKCV